MPPPPAAAAPKKGANPALVAAAAVLLLALVGGGGWYAWSRLAPGKGAEAGPEKPSTLANVEPTATPTLPAADAGAATQSATSTGTFGSSGNATTSPTEVPGNAAGSESPMGQVAETAPTPASSAADARPRPNPRGPGMSRSDDRTSSQVAAEREPPRPDDGEVALPRREALVDGGSWSLDTQVEKAYTPLDTTRTKGRLTREALAEAGGAAREITSSRDEPEARFIDLYTRAGSAFASGDNATAWQQLHLAFEVDTAGAAGGRVLRFVRKLMRGKGRNPGPDANWILGLAFGDVRGDLDEELEAAAERAPRNKAVLFARALRAVETRDGRKGASLLRQGCSDGIEEACLLLGRR
jgi:hypothetical protein